MKETNEDLQVQTFLMRHFGPSSAGIFYTSYLALGYEPLKMRYAKFIRDNDIWHAVEEKDFVNQNLKKLLKKINSEEKANVSEVAHQAVLIELDAQAKMNTFLCYQEALSKNDQQMMYEILRYHDEDGMLLEFHEKIGKYNSMKGCIV